MESMLFGVFRGRWATGVFLLIFFCVLFCFSAEKRRRGKGKRRARVGKGESTGRRPCKITSRIGLGFVDIRVPDSWSCQDADAQIARAGAR